MKKRKTVRSAVIIIVIIALCFLLPGIVFKITDVLNSGGNVQTADNTSAGMKPENFTLSDKLRITGTLSLTTGSAYDKYIEEIYYADKKETAASACDRLMDEWTEFSIFLNFGEHPYSLVKEKIDDYAGYLVTDQETGYAFYIWKMTFHENWGSISLIMDDAAGTILSAYIETDESDWIYDLMLQDADLLTEYTEMLSKDVFGPDIEEENNISMTFDDDKPYDQWLYSYDIQLEDAITNGVAAAIVGTYFADYLGADIQKVILGNEDQEYIPYPAVIEIEGASVWICTDGYDIIINYR